MNNHNYFHFNVGGKIPFSSLGDIYAYCEKNQVEFDQIEIEERDGKILFWHLSRAPMSV